MIDLESIIKMAKRAKRLAAPATCYVIKIMTKESNVENVIAKFEGVKRKELENTCSQLYQLLRNWGIPANNSNLVMQIES